MDKTYCSYICSGCGIGDALDIEALSEVVTDEMSMECKSHECLCGAEGRALIEKDISDGINTVVVGACSPRVMGREFDFGDDKITVRANLREQVVWAEAKPAEGEDPHAEAAEFLMETASDYMRMACTRAQKTELPEPYLLEVLNKTILVMGGGLAGLTAAKETAAAGYDVILVEKEAELGGRASGWRKSFPTKAPWTDLEENPIDALIAEVTGNNKITVKKNGRYPAHFGLQIKYADESEEIKNYSAGVWKNNQDVFIIETESGKKIERVELLDMAVIDADKSNNATGN